MSKQLYVYATPKEMEALLLKACEEYGGSLISPMSRNGEPIWLNTPVRDSPLLGPGSTSISCCLIPNGLAKLGFEYYAKQATWHLMDDSEVISVTGCDFDKQVLVRGRFYCHTDVLVNQEIRPMSPDFLRWTDRILSFVKKELNRSQRWDAYVGIEALRLQDQGVHFASMAFPGGKVVFAE